MIQERIEVKEAVELAAEDSEFYCRFFFPKTCKQPSPPFHKICWEALEANRYVDVEVFRDGAKTSLLRMFASKRIAYAISKTIVIVGKGQDHAIKTIRWLKRQVTYNKKWAKTFGLVKGDKWTDEWIQIRHEVDDSEINIVAYGMTGQIRGINIDDFRPDMIMIDDPCDEENTGTPEQRKKMDDLFFGALKNCLVPETEDPSALMCLLQTGLHKEDVLHRCKLSTEWFSLTFGVFDDDIESIWPERYPTETLLREKQGYADRNQLSLWMREKECKISSPETSIFRPTWINFYELLPESYTCVVVVDPVPPPSDAALDRGLRGKDFEAVGAICRYGDDYFIASYSTNRGHTPEWTVAEIFRYCMEYRPLYVVVEGTNYQRTLAWLLAEAMKVRRIWYPIAVVDEKTQKVHKITQALSGIAAHGHLLCKPDQMEFIEQFTDYPDVANDDVIEMVAIGVKKLMEIGDIIEGDYTREEENIPELNYEGGCP